MNPQLSTFWSLPTDQVLQQTHSTTAGLSRQDAKQRLSRMINQGYIYLSRYSHLKPKIDGNRAGVLFIPGMA
jgi:ribulose bisphosphate carboxylase small subunit